MASFFWREDAVEPQLHALLNVLADEYPLSAETGGRELIFRRTDNPGELKVSHEKTAVRIEYGGALNTAARGVGLALAEENTASATGFTTLGIMLDCSRNAVMTLPHLKKWLRRLALMGYNMAMLYTEDTYQLPGEPYFGYMRGAYSMSEIKELDAFAATLGIEMIACIQTLGHLEQIMHWQAYDDIRDTTRVMLVDEPRTYQLIDKMVAFWTEALSSRRIHVGMDETHDLGRGKFMDKFGYERGFDIFNRHLDKVVEICTGYGQKPMIWSDMYFRMGCSNGDYYNPETVIPEDVKNKIPARAELVYWDYYHRDREFYEDWIQRHRELGFEPLMGSGVWTWARLWYDPQITEATVRPCIEACTAQGLSEIFFTLWGDDGAYCEYDSCLAGLCWSADLAFGGDGDAGRMEKVFKAITGGGYANYIAGGGLDLYRGDKYAGTNIILWDDPLLGKWLNEMEKRDAQLVPDLLARYRQTVVRLEKCADDNAWADVGHALITAKTLLYKLETMLAMREAYNKGDRIALKSVREKMVPEMSALTTRMAESFREQWLRRNKPFGLETMQVRFGGMIARWQETERRLGEFLEGKIDTIAELDAKLESESAQAGAPGVYRVWASGSTIL